MINPFYENLKELPIFVGFDNNKNPYGVDGDKGVSKADSLHRRGTYEEIKKLGKQFIGIGLAAPVQVGDKFLVCLDFDWKRSKDLKPHPKQWELIQKLTNEGHAYETSHSGHGCHFWVLMDKDKIPGSAKLGAGYEIEVFSGMSHGHSNVLVTDREPNGALKTLTHIDLPQIAQTTHSGSIDPSLMSKQQIWEIMNASGYQYDPYDDWLAMGMALHKEFEGEDTGFDLWAQWAKQGKLFDEKESRDKWESFKVTEDGIGLGSLIWAALANGYKFPHRETAEEAIAKEEAINPWFDRVSPLCLEITPPNWLLEGLLADKLTMIAGSPGVGKTSCLVPMALAAAGLTERGSEIRCNHPRKVIYVTEDKWQIDLIVHGILKHMVLEDGSKPTLAQIAERFIVVSTKKSKINELVKIEELAKQYIVDASTEMKDIQLKPLIVFDTASASFYMDDENDNAEGSKFMAGIKESLIENDYPVWIVAHIAKGLKRSDAKDLSVRGAGAFEGDSNCIAYLVEETGVEERFFVLGKRRYSPKFDTVMISSQLHHVTALNKFDEIEEISYRYVSLFPSDKETRDNYKALGKLTTETKDKSIYVNTKKAEILNTLEKIGECSATVLAEKSPGANPRIAALIKELIDDGYITTKPGKTRGTLVSRTDKKYEV